MRFPLEKDTVTPLVKPSIEMKFSFLDPIDSHPGTDTGDSVQLTGSVGVSFTKTSVRAADTELVIVTYSQYHSLKHSVSRIL